MGQIKREVKSMSGRNPGLLGPVSGRRLQETLGRVSEAVWRELLR